MAKDDRKKRVDELRRSLDALQRALEQYDHPPEEQRAMVAAVEVQDGLNALLESNAVTCEGIVRLGTGKSGALLRINGSTQAFLNVVRDTSLARV
jgi:Ni,Fe-hydrogenase III large subunit